MDCGLPLEDDFLSLSHSVPFFCILLHSVAFHHRPGTGHSNVHSPHTVKWPDMRLNDAPCRDLVSTCSSTPTLREPQLSRSLWRSFQGFVSLEREI
jgi:hypothetical protein